MLAPGHGPESPCPSRNQRSVLWSATTGWREIPSCSALSRALGINVWWADSGRSLAKRVTIIARRPSQSFQPHGQAVARERSSLDQLYSSTQGSRQRFWFIPLHLPWSWSVPALKPTSSDREWYSSISVSSPATSGGGSYGVWPPPSVLRQQPPRE